MGLLSTNVLYQKYTLSEALALYHNLVNTHTCTVYFVLESFFYSIICSIYIINIYLVICLLTFLWKSKCGFIPFEKQLVLLMAILKKRGKNLTTPPL